MPRPPASSAAARPCPGGRAPPDTIGTGRTHGATAAPLPATAPARPAAQGGGGIIILTHPSEEARRAGEGPSLAGAQRAGIPRDAGARAERSVSLWQRPRRYSLHIAAGNGTAAPRRTAHAPGPSGGGAALRLRRPQTIALPGLRALPARPMAGGKQRFPLQATPICPGRDGTGAELAAGPSAQADGLCCAQARLRPRATTKGRRVAETTLPQLPGVGDGRGLYRRRRGACRGL